MLQTRCFYPGELLVTHFLTHQWKSFLTRKVGSEHHFVPKIRYNPKVSLNMCQAGFHRIQTLQVGIHDWPASFFPPTIKLWRLAPWQGLVSRGTILERLSLHDFPKKREKSPEGRAEDLEMKADVGTDTRGSILALPFFTFLVQLPARHPSSRPITIIIIYRFWPSLSGPWESP